MDVKLNIKLHENQRVIDSSVALYKVAKCGKRFGKTKWAIYALTRAAGLKPGGVFWYIAPTYRQAKNIAWREFKNLIPPQYIKRSVENELLIMLVNDASIQLIGADNEDSLRGPKLDGVVFDEVAYINKYIWNQIIRGQLLGSGGEESGFAWFISSPLNPIESMGKNKEDWYPEFYQEALRKRQAGNMSWDAFHFTIYDNPTLSRDQIDEIKADSTEDAWGVEYLANESAHAGHVYSEFNYARHVMECESGSSVLVRGLDWGIAHPTVALFVYVDAKDKRIYVEDEYVKSDFTIEESCEVILKKTGSREVEWTISDPSLAKRNAVTGKADKLEFDRCGVFSFPGDNNKRGYNILKMFLKRDIIRINPKCRITIKQLRELQWTDKVDDDCTDVLRYICVRIHDLMFKWKDVQIVEVKQEIEGMFNLNDKDLFPKHALSNSSNIKEEIRAY